MGITAEALKILAKAGQRGLGLRELSERLSRHPSTVYLTVERARLEGCLTRQKTQVGDRLRYVYYISEYGRRKLTWLSKRRST